MNTDAVRRQKLSNARFQCKSIMDQLLYIQRHVTGALEDALILHPNVASYSIPAHGCLSDAHIENTHRLVRCEPSFEPQSYTHLCVVSGYIGGIVLPKIMFDNRALQTDDCDESVIERWQCWASIEMRLRLKLPILGMRGLTIDERVRVVGVVLRGAWEAVRVAVPMNVECGGEPECSTSVRSRRGGRGSPPQAGMGF